MGLYLRRPEQREGVGGGVEAEVQVLLLVVMVHVPVLEEVHVLLPVVIEVLMKMAKDHGHLYNCRN